MNVSRIFSCRGILSLFSLMVLALSVSSCDADDMGDTPEGRIQSFVNQYFPGIAVSSQNTLADGDIQVTLKGSATILFDSEGTWTNINGNGVTLPAVLLYDQLPSPLYKYIEEMEDTEGVFRIIRDSSSYQVYFLDSAITYGIATSKITYITDGN